MLDFEDADHATFRTLQSSRGIPGLQGLRVCLRTDKDLALASDPDLHQIIFGLERAGLEWCDKHVADEGDSAQARESQRLTIRIGCRGLGCVPMEA